MVGKVVFVAGLPGSGKSEYVCKLTKDIGGEPIHDFKNEAINNNPNFNFSRHFERLIAGLNAGRTFVVADVGFCSTQSRRQANEFVRQLAPGAEIKWCFFENEPEQCKRNARARAEVTPRDLQREIDLIEYYSPHYYIPPGSTTMPVWRPYRGGHEGKDRSRR
jgi:predicted kinase